MGKALHLLKRLRREGFKAIYPLAPGNWYQSSGAGDSYWCGKSLSGCCGLF